MSYTSDDIDFKNRSRSIDISGNQGNRADVKSSKDKLAPTAAKGTKEKSGGFLTSLFMPRGASKNKQKPLISGEAVKSDTRSMSNADRDKYDIRPSDLRSTFMFDMKNDDNSADPVFNLMDSYAALLCCSVIHSKLIDGLCFLAIHSEKSLAVKSRNLLVGILRTISNIFPESSCSDLLSMPYLIDFASIFSSRWSNRSEKASEVLHAMADAFSIASIDQFKSLKEGDKIGAFLKKSDVIEDLSKKSIRSSSFVQDWSSVNKSDSSRSSIMSNTVYIFDVASEVKKSSHSRIFSLVESSTNHLSNKSKIVIDLRLALISAIDKNDFSKQMDSSRVLGKDGKEPLKWDWSMINDMLEFSFHNPDRLAEALRTKFIRRLSGFYRCTNDEKVIHLINMTFFIITWA
jgi:hypothetical protein